MWGIEIIMEHVVVTSSSDIWIRTYEPNKTITKGNGQGEKQFLICKSIMMKFPLSIHE